MNQRNAQLLCIIFVFSIFSILFSAPSGRVEGYVLDSQTQETLPGANVIIDGTFLGSSTDLNGKFVISNVPFGVHKLIVRYIGYQEKSVEILVEDGKTVKKVIKVDFQSLEGEVIEVTVQAKGQMEAINQQRANLKVTNIVSADRIQEVPDANAAESVGRLPGVSVKRSSGEGNEIVIRGLQPRLNLVTINGMRMPSTNESNTSVGLAGISQYMLDGIEVRKSLNAEDDADVVGGIVDLKLATAPEGFHLNAIVDGMYNGLTNSSGSFRGSLQGSARFFDNKLGVIGQVNLEKADRTNHGLTGGYGPDTRTDTTIAPTVGLGSGNFRLYDIVRDRFGVNVLLDYRLPKGKIQFNSIYNKLNEDRWERKQVFNTGFTGTPSLQKEHYSIYEENYSLVNGLNIETELLGFANFDFSASLAKGVRDGDTYQLNIGYDQALEVPIDPWFREHWFGQNAYDIVPYFTDEKENYEVWQLQHNEAHFNENEKTFQSNLNIPFSLGKIVTGNVKFGGKLRLKERDYDYGENGGPIYGGDDDLIVAIVRDNPELDWPWEYQDVPASPTLPAYPLYSEDKEKILRDKVVLKWFSERKYVDNLVKRADAASWAFISQKLWQAADLGKDYNGNEKFYAGYFMTDFNFGNKISLNAGVRYENEKTTYQGYGVQTVASQDDDLDSLDASTRKNEYILPSTTLRYNYADWGDIRLAYYKSLSRPEYYAFIPHYFADLRTSLEGNPAGNPSLKPSVTNNFDLIFSFYNNYIGLFTVGGFYKQIDDYYYIRTFKVVDQAEDNKILPYDALTVLKGQKISLFWNNTKKAYVKGLEFDWQTNFWYLPFPFNGLVLTANFTKIKSNTRYYFAEDELLKIPTDLNGDGTIRPWEFEEVLVDTLQDGALVDQPEDIFNFSIGYDYKDFSMRLTYYFQGTSLGYKSDNKSMNSYDDNYSRFDLSVRQKLPLDGLSVQLLWSNITDEREREHVFSNYFGSEEEYYGSSAYLGLRYEF